MTKEVLVSISGMRMTDGEKEDIEVITTGDYYKRNGKHFILYEEISDDVSGVTKSTMKIGENVLDIIKRGASNARMSFRENEKLITNYMTPFGEMIIGINTNKITVDETEDNLKIRVNYGLDINYTHVSDCDMIVDIMSKGTAHLNL